MMCLRSAGVAESEGGFREPEIGGWSLQQGNEANEAKTFRRESWPRRLTWWVNRPGFSICRNELVLRCLRELL